MLSASHSATALSGAELVSDESSNSGTLALSRHPLSARMKMLANEDTGNQIGKHATLEFAEVW